MEKGLFIVYTGDGKGKTTAALGLAIRCMGWGKRACVIQFLKSEDFLCGERLMAEKIGLELYAAGIGYSWTKTEEEQLSSIKKAWELAKKKLSENYDLIILDEINNVFGNSSVDFSKAISIDEVLEVLEHRPDTMDVVLTGRNAPKQFIDAANTVTEMKAVKHAFETGIQARKGMEF